MHRPIPRLAGKIELARVAGALLLAATLTSPAGAQSAGVTIDNFTFSPADLTVTAGSTVTWTNADDIPHTVTSDAKLFKSKPLDTNDHFSFTFSKPGQYAYFCSLHPHMTGKILVKAP